MLVTDYLILIYINSALLPPFIFFFFNDTATTEIYTLSLHDALPICARGQRDAPRGGEGRVAGLSPARQAAHRPRPECPGFGHRDRKSTRLNSSHLVISYAVFCLKKKKNRNLAERHDHFQVLHSVAWI